MATHAVDQKSLAHLARGYHRRFPKLAQILFQVLGVSIMLGPRLVRARRLSRENLVDMEDGKKRRLLEEIIWLTRAGLELVNDYLAPRVAAAAPDTEEADVRLKVFSAKLRSSFYHVLCLFRNDPPLTRLAEAVAAIYESLASEDPSPQSSGSRSGRKSGRRTSQQNKGRSSGKAAEDRNFRESMISEASMVTNPWSNTSPPPPPGLTVLPDFPSSMNFLLPTWDWLPVAKGSFNDASTVATQYLPASSPLRLSVALEHVAFLWDCVHDHDGSRKLARTTIREVYRTNAGLTDEDFADAQSFVGTLGRMMRRRSQDGTPRFGGATPPSANVPSSQVPPLPRTQVIPPTPTAPVRRPATSTAPFATGTAEQIAHLTGEASLNVPPFNPPSQPLPAIPATTSPSRPQTRRRDPADTSGTPPLSITRQAVPPSAPPLGSSSPEQGTQSSGRSAAPSSTVPTATSTPRLSGSPKRTRRIRSDEESPTRRHRTRPRGSRG